MTSDIENWAKQCDRCLRRKSATNTRAPLVNIHTTYPLELVCFDFLSLETSKGGFSNILVITDHFSKFAVAIPTRNQTTKTTAEAFFTNFIVKYGIPTRLHSDQGANFESELIKELCHLMNMKKSHTTVYHPQGNAGPEIFNRTLLSMLGTLENSQKTDWKKYIDALVFSYNCTLHESTRVSPCEILFLRKPKLPIDAMFELAGEKAERRVGRAKKKQKYYYDKKVRGVKLEKGDQVLVKVLSRGEGRYKLADKYEEELYTVVNQPIGDIPVFQIEGNETGRVKKLHRNHLYLVDYRMRREVDDEEQEEDAQEETEVDVEEKEKDGIEEGDVTRDSSDDEEGSVFVPQTIIHGNAREPELQSLEEENIEDEPEVDNESTDTAVAESVEGTDVMNTVDDSVQENEDTTEEEVNVLPEEEIELPYRERLNETITTENTTLETIDESEITVDENPVREERVEVQERRRRPRTLPPDPPRRSERHRKMPEKYDQYVLYGMQGRPFDKKLHALRAMISSDVLSNIDEDVARRMIKAIMK